MEREERPCKPVYIYKITNNINGKVYIGKSNNPKRRVHDHYICKSSSKALSNDIKLYHIYNFSWCILCKCDSADGAVEEQYYIKKHKELGVELYNISKGGETPPVTLSYKYDDESFKAVYDTLINCDKPSVHYQEIADKCGVEADYVRRINNGNAGYRVVGATYPLKTTYDEVTDMIINDLLNTRLTQRDIAKKYGVARSMVTMINIGHNHYNPNIDYPIRKGSVRNNKIVEGDNCCV